jgi:hypothetical protein
MIKELFMIVFFEVDKRFIAKPGYFKNNIMQRAWWLWFSIGIIHEKLEEFACREHNWVNNTNSLINKINR